MAVRMEGAERPDYAGMQEKEERGRRQGSGKMKAESCTGSGINRGGRKQLSR